MRSLSRLLIVMAMGISGCSSINPDLSAAFSPPHDPPKPPKSVMLVNLKIELDEKMYKDNEELYAEDPTLIQRNILVELNCKRRGVLARLSAPIDLGNGFWLNKRLLAATLGQTNYDASKHTATMGVRLEANPEITHGRKPTGNLVLLELGDSIITTGTNSDLRVSLRGSVPFGQAQKIMWNAVRGERFPLGTSWPMSQMEISVTRIGIKASGRNVIFEVATEGVLSGTYFLFGEPVFENNHSGTGGVIRIKDMDFVPGGNSLFFGFVNLFAHEKLRLALENAAQWNVTDKLANQVESLNAKLNNSEVKPGVRLNGHISEIGTGSIWVSTAGFEAYYSVTGKLTVGIDATVKDDAGAKGPSDELPVDKSKLPWYCY